MNINVILKCNSITITNIYNYTYIINNKFHSNIQKISTIGFI